MNDSRRNIGKQKLLFARSMEKLPNGKTNEFQNKLSGNNFCSAHTISIEKEFYLYQTYPLLNRFS